MMRKIECYTKEKKKGRIEGRLKGKRFFWLAAGRPGTGKTILAKSRSPEH